MALQHTPCLILTSLLFTTLIANELPTISLSGGYGLNSDHESPRLLETASLAYSFMYPIAAVQADLGELYYQRNDISEIERNRTMMIVTISSNETGFIKHYNEAGILNSFNCDPLYCDLADSSTVRYRSTWIRGYPQRINLEIPVSIGNGAWQLQTSVLYFAESPDRSVTYGFLGVGWIGLGTSGEARKNFQTENPIFSIVYDKPSDTGNLIFGFNSSLVDDSKPAATVTTTPNWEMELISINVGDKSVYLAKDSQPQFIVFDLISSDIQMSQDIVPIIMLKLSQYGLNCFDFGCTSETLEGLPPIVFTLSNNTQISLSPDVYMKEFALRAGPAGYATIGFGFRRPLEGSKTPFVFGRNILAHYYSVFEQVDQINTITLYSLAPSATISNDITPSMPKQSEIPISEPLHIDTPSSSIGFIFVIIGICVVVVLGFDCAKILQEKRSQTESKQIDQSNTNIEMQKPVDDDGMPLSKDFNLSDGL